MNRTRWTFTVMLALLTALLMLLAGCGTEGVRARKNAQSVDSAYDSAPTGILPYSRESQTRTAAEVNALRAAMPEGSLPGLDEEVWVIVKSEADEQTADTDDEIPGSGALVTHLPTETGDPEPHTIPLPLKHTEVATDISAYIASVNVTQQFHNPFFSKIEAVYVFPLPQNAAITGFVMTIGDRKIRGILREREQAEQIYQEARSQGYVAALLTQQRPNVFTQSVANIEPGRKIDVDITYFHTLSYDDGWYEYVFPMVVGPRFNPPGTTDGIGAVPSSPRATSPQKTKVHYLSPRQRSGHDIGLTVAINAGVPIEAIECNSHEIEVQGLHSSESVVRLAAHDSIPNKDFVLRYRVAGEHVQAGLLAKRTEEGGYFTLMLYPPSDLSELERAPVEMVFVMDCSGSMSGEPLKLAKKAVVEALNSMQPQDTFQVIRFSNDASHFGPRPVPADAQNVRNAISYVRNLQANGGTMMIRGIRAALDFPHEEGRTRFVVFLTDGYIGNEHEILTAINERLGDTHIFSFGIGSSPNRFLLSRMAKLGRGAVANIGLRDNAENVMQAFMKRASHPALTDIAIDWGGLNAYDIVPNRLPALFVGRPVIVTGRYDADVVEENLQVRLQGTVAGRRVERVVSAAPAGSGEFDALPAVWARANIAAIMDRATYQSNHELSDQVRTLALNYGLMSAYTAYIAVDSTRRTEGESGTTVPVSVPVPEGVKYSTTVSQSSN